MDNKNKEIGGKIFNEIKSKLTKTRKYNKDNGFTNVFDGFSRMRQQVDIDVLDNTIWKDGRKIVKSYIIKVDGEDFAEVSNHYCVAEIFGELRNLLSAQKKVKGWSGLNYMSERVQLASCDWSGYEVSIVPKVCLSDAPCTEYKSLMNYINKYGVSDGYGSYPVRMTNYEFFSAAMGGKRGSLWDEYGERLFLDNKPKKCARILAELRKIRGSKDRMVCKRGEEKYMDDIERQYSIMNEIECDGEKRQYLSITIKTPQGKVKYETKIY